MTEKQIFKRMNEAYEQVYGDCIEDEWYGDDDPMVWKFYRPSTDVCAKLVMRLDEKRIDIYEVRDHEFVRIGNYTW